MFRSADEANTPVATVKFATIEDVKTQLAGTIDPEQVDRQLDGIVTECLSIGLFAVRALLVEGGTDAAVFYGIGDREAVGRLESQGISIVSANSKGGIPLAHAILNCLGIPTYVVFDGDAGFEARAKAKGKPLKDIAGQRTKFSTENRRLLKYFGETEADFPGERVGDRLATMSDNLESYLDSNWAEWRMAHAEIESAAGIQLAKNQYAYRAATREARGPVPEMLKQILARAGGM